MARLTGGSLLRHVLSHSTDHSENALKGAAGVSTRFGI